MWIEILKDKKFRSTNAGGKLVAQMFDFIFNEPAAGKTPWKLPIPQTPEAEADANKSGAPRLPPLRPDPAKVASFNEGEQR